MATPGAIPPSPTPLAAADFDQVEALFDACVALAPEQRRITIDAACRERPDLELAVDALLMAHDRMEVSSPSEDARSPRLTVGARVGAYHLVELVGEGGMGEVYRAERVDGGFTQQVALKIVRSTLDREDLARRFKVERQILASLSHPNIVTMLDGGATGDGQAYLVMEYVQGTSITHHCRERALRLDERLRLFRTVCEAVRYAHQHGIVHRDLKPANILILPDGVPKVLDFGVAKLLNAPTDDGSATVGLLPGPLTPNYASPEQLRGLPVTTASDVYALGVLLYELVAGVRPYETQGQTLDRILALVVTQSPGRPSAASAGPDAPLPYARQRLRGDIDAIVLKAMSKEATERYDSAGELASDIGRVLDGQPVLARAPSPGYVLRRLAARNKTVVAVFTIALAAILTASGVAIWQRQVARREQARAETLVRDVRQLANALIFKIHDAVVPLPGSTDVRRTIVNEAIAYLERLEAESRGDIPLALELAAGYRQIAGILGDPQRANLGDRDGAIRHYERAHAITLALVTDEARYDVFAALAEADRPLSTLYSLKGDRDRATTAAREAVDHSRQFQQRHPDDNRGPKLVATSTFNLAWALPVAESVAVWQQLLEYYEGQLALQPQSAEVQRNVALMAKYLGSALASLGEEVKALAHHARALELDEARLAAAPDDRQTQFDAAISFANVAASEESAGDLERATRLFERSMTLRRRLVASDSKDVLARERLGYAITRVARLYRQQGKADDGKALTLEAIAIGQAVFATTNDRTARTTLAFAWLELGRVEQGARDQAAACRAFGRAHELYRERPETESDVRTVALAAAAARETATCIAKR